MEQNGSWTANKHLLIMLACCLIPLAVLAAVLVFNVSLGTLGFFAILLLCPLMHLFMMRGMGHDHASDKGSCHKDTPDTSQSL